MKDIQAVSDRFLTEPHELESEPLAGALFALSPGVTGLANEKFIA